jgi:cytochrome c553
MTPSSGSEPHERRWRNWASAAVIATVLSGILLGVLIIPVVQGRNEGIDAYTAICRALGILPGSPARQQVFDRTPPTPVSQVIWTPGVLQILAEARPERGRTKVQEVCIACHGEQGVAVSRQYPNLAGQSGAAITERLPNRQSHKSVDDGYRKGAGRGDARRCSRILRGPAEARSRSDDTRGIPSGHRASGRTRGPQPQHPALRGVPPARLGRPHRGPHSVRARSRLPRLAAEDVCLGRPPQ